MTATPPVEDVARALYYANRGKAPMAWERLKDDAILVQGRRDYWRQMVQAVYDAMDKVDPPPVMLGLCGIYEVYKYAVDTRKSGEVFFVRCPVCQRDWQHHVAASAMELFLSHLTPEPSDVGR